MRKSYAKAVTSLILLAGAIAVGCSKDAEDCNYIGTCGRLSGGSSANDGGNSGGTSAGGNSAGGTFGEGGSTTSGTGGMATGGVTSACGTGCSGTTPVCNESAKTCVECTADGNCSGAKPACNTATNICVECVKDGNCSASRPACKTEQSTDAGTDTDAGTGMNTCVQCTKNEHCSGTTPLCDTSKNLCVECLTNHDCPSVSASLCSAGTCSPCAADAECSHIEGKTVCKPASSTNHRPPTPNPDAGTDPDAGTGTGTGTGTCVQCTGTDYSICGQLNGKNLVCDSLSDTCSTTLTEHSVGLCKTCVSDAQCAAGELCAEQTYNGKSVGYFCFYKQGDTENGAPADCTATGRPYFKVFNTTSIDGQTTDLCTLAVSTCPALNEFRSVCNPTGTPDPNLCGFAPGLDSECVQASPTSSQYRCTVTCLSDDDCRSGVTCNTDVNPPVCNFQ